MGEAEPSDRLVSQRVRNRIMEELSMLAGGNAAVREFGWDYLLDFFDWFPDAPALSPAAELMTPDEKTRLSKVLLAMERFKSELPEGATIDQLIGSGWPCRIAPLAKEAYDVFATRGWFSEEHEEAEPSEAVVR